MVEMVQLLRGLYEPLSTGKPIKNGIKGSNSGVDRELIQIQEPLKPIFWKRKGHHQWKKRNPIREMK